jgi:hypothetical protein
VGEPRAAELAAMFSRLTASISATPGQTSARREHLNKMSSELQAELGQERPDPGILERLKNALSSVGGQVGAATAAIFAYGPVQDTSRAAMQRLLGG